MQIVDGGMNINGIAYYNSNAKRSIHLSLALNSILLLPASTT